jgi:thymidylate kinase
MIISFSGLDSSGKGTQIKSLSLFLSNSSISYNVMWARPGYTPIFVWLKSLFFRNPGITQSALKTRKNTALSNKFLSSIWFSISIIDLFIYWGIYLRLLNKKKLIILDRYILDTFVDLSFQFKNFDIVKLLLYKTLKFVVPAPDVSIFLDLKPHDSIVRQALKNDSYPVDLASLKIKYHLYQSELNNLDNFCSIDANLSPHFIERIIRNKLGLLN